MTGPRTTASVRQRLSLDGEWELLVPGQSPRTVQVPGPWQLLPDLRSYTGTARYRRRMAIPRGWDGKRIRLCFGAVDYRAAVEVNGVGVGEHEGGYLPFEFEIQHQARAGSEALIEVTVADDMAPDVPKGKQSWYGPLAGIWQPVWLEAVGDLYTRALRVEADAASGTVAVHPSLGGDAGGHSFRLAVRGPDGERVTTDTLTATMAGARRWDLDTPHLYMAELSVLRDGAVVDTTTVSFGFRSIEARDGRIWLNGRPILLVGALDQDYYPHTMCTPPSDAFLRRQLERAKELGLNCLRCHIKVPDPRYLDWADRMGILIWSELPNWETLTPEAEARARTTVAGMIERDANHPSIVAWTIINESWGVDLAANDKHRAWLRDMVGLVRSCDPTRIVVDNSACRPNFHVGGDLNDFHFYSSIPDQRARWDAWLEGWTSDPAATYSPHGDESRRGDEPMVVSEFGNWGLPDPAGLLEDDDSEPWWFATGEDWSPGGVVHPSGVTDRAREWKLDEVFGGLGALFHASQEHQFESIQYEVEQMRLHPEIAGFVVTEFTDVYWECNGLLDLHRRPKAGHTGYRWIFGADLPVAVPDRRRCFAGEEITLRVHIAHASERDLEGAALRWRLSDGSAPGSCAISVGGWEAPAVAEVSLRPDGPGRHRFQMELVDSSGEVIGRNWTDLAVFAPAAHRIPVWSEDAGLTSLLEEVQWPIDRMRGVPLGCGLDSVDRGVQLARPGDAAAGVRVVARDGTPWEADWAQGMHWLGPQLRAGTPLLPRLDLCCTEMIPPAILTGPVPAETLSGMYVGWIRQSVATTARLGPGLIATTFPLEAAGASDPMAVALLSNLVRAAQE